MVLCDCLATFTFSPVENENVEFASKFIEY